MFSIKKARTPRQNISLKQLSIKNLFLVPGNQKKFPELGSKQTAATA